MGYRGQHGVRVSSGLEGKLCTAHDLCSSVPQQGVVGPSGPPGPPGFPGDLGLPVRASLRGVFVSGHEVSGCGAKVGNVRV